MGALLCHAILAPLQAATQVAVLAAAVAATVAMGAWTASQEARRLQAAVINLCASNMGGASGATADWALLAVDPLGLWGPPAALWAHESDEGPAISWRHNVGASPMARSQGTSDLSVSKQGALFFILITLLDARGDTCLARRTSMTSMGAALSVSTLLGVACCGTWGVALGQAWTEWGTTPPPHPKGMRG